MHYIPLIICNKMTSKTILGTDYQIDDRIKLLANFLSDYSMEPNIEIEAKVGIFHFNRVIPNFSHVTLLDHASTPFRFESNLPETLFQSIMDKLAELNRKFEYHEMEDHIYSASGNSKLRRVISSDGQILRVEKKTSLYSLNFLVNPATGMGFRITASKEELIEDIPPTAKCNLIRHKKRHSFPFDYLSLDFTKVEVPSRKNGSGVSHELEFEISDINFVRKHVEDYQTNVNKNYLLGIAQKIYYNVLSLATFNAPAPRPAWEGDLEFQRFEDERKKIYTDSLGYVQPIVGDYMFSICQEQNEPLDE